MLVSVVAEKSEKSIIRKWIYENPHDECKGEEMEELIKMTKTKKQI